MTATVTGIDPDLAAIRRQAEAHRWPRQYAPGTPVAVRVWADVAVAESGCWDYGRAKNAGGYGVILVGGKPELVHRVAWKLSMGAVPDSGCVLHACDRPSCCRPSHLWLGTRVNNNADRVAKGRSRGLAGEANPASRLAAEDVIAIRASRASISAIARQFGVTRRTIRLIQIGETWQHVGVPA